MSSVSTQKCVYPWSLAGRFASFGFPSGDGNWTIKIMPASGADAFDGSAKGKKDTVLRYSGDDIDIAATHDGDDEFTVATYDKNGVLVETTLDEYGEVDDSYPMAAGAYIAIKTSGNWTLDEE